MTEVIRAKDLKSVSESARKRTERLAQLRATPFDKLSAEDKDFLLQEVAGRLGLLPLQEDDT